MKYVIIGHGGHGKVISDLILSNEENKVIGFLDDKYQEFKLIGNLYFGPVQSARNIIEAFSDFKFVMAIGDNLVRKTLVEKLALPEELYTPAIHKSAVVSSSAKIGLGTVVMPNAVINADAEVGAHCIINTSSVVEHDCKIKDFVHICPGASLTGGVQIGIGTTIGTGTSIVPGIRVGDWAKVGAGAAVVHDIPSFSTAVGIPARANNHVKVN